MSATLAFWRTPRGKMLAGLAATTLLFVILASLTLIQDARTTAPRFTPVALFPDLAGKLVDAAEVSIATADSTLTLRRVGDDPASAQWVVPSAYGYPAKSERVRRVLLGLSDLKAVDAKTARADWHAALELGDPKNGGGATAITVTDAKGATLAAVLLGKLRPGGPNGGAEVYVRRIGEDQTYLATGDVPANAVRGDWLESEIVELARERIKRALVNPPASPAYALIRHKAEDPNFVLETLPAGREMVSDTVANATGAAVVDVTLDDVKPQGEIDFTGAARIAFETFDGLTVRLDLVSVGKDEEAVSWLKVAATGTTAETTREAAAITARTKDWAYAIPSWKADLMMKPLESLLKSKGVGGAAAE